MSVIRKLIRLYRSVDDLAEMRTLLGKLYFDRIRDSRNTGLSGYEFKVYSQFGDDGIIQHLINSVPVGNKFFVEFGVGDYSESNTRYLLMNDNWSGFVMDGSAGNIRRLKGEDIFWKYDIQAQAAFITRDNINPLLKNAGLPDDIGLLGIDLDGNDYWIWEALDIAQLKPAIVILEYNSLFGPDRAITIPYSERFYRRKAHYSNLYWGASLKALCLLSKRKGYAFIGCNNAGNNAYFLRREILGNFRELTAQEGYVSSKFRESRDKNGRLSFLRGSQRSGLIRGLKVYNIESGLVEEV